MEINEKQSRQLDEILVHLLKLNGHATSVENINNELFPDETYEYCLSLFYILENYYPKLLYPENDVQDNCFWAREYVKAFLNNGGFSRLFDSSAEVLRKKEEKEKLELEKLNFDTKNARRVYKTYWFTFAFALIALLISLYNLLKDFIK
jgi:hypothetical protein